MVAFIRAVVSRDTIFQKSQSSEVSVSFQHLQASENRHVSARLAHFPKLQSAVCFISPMELFQLPKTPKAILLQGYLIMCNQWFCDAKW